MRVLILGGAGMLGHKLVQQLGPKFETWVTFRGNARDYAEYGIFDEQRAISGVDVSAFDTVVRAVAKVKPQAVINCIGIIKQLATATDPLLSIETNSLFPHRLANLCAAAGARVIHISTDCVFSGARGQYQETDPSDAQDLYGRTKFLGEISGDGALTLRTSIIGRELRTTTGLVEWFLAQRGKRVQGWRRAIYTGFPTLTLAGVIADILENHPRLSGLYQVASQPIDKYELLCLVRDAYRVDAELEPFDGIAIDRSLDGSRFREATGFRAPSWKELVQQMAADPTPYEVWRTPRVAAHS
jgi:dTDP-4-dehydrorhamnose reductase